MKSLIFFLFISTSVWAECPYLPEKKCVQLQLKQVISQDQDKSCLIQADLGADIKEVFFKLCPDLSKHKIVVGDLVQRSDITIEGKAQCKYEFKEKEETCSMMCVCNYITSLETELKQSSAVFLGTVISISNTDKDFKLVNFEVEKSWKTIRGSKAQIKIGRMNGFHFEVGKKYLVFASEKSPQYTHCCGLTMLADMALENIKKLGPSIPLK